MSDNNPNRIDQDKRWYANGDKSIGTTPAMMAAHDAAMKPYTTNKFQICLFPKYSL